MLLYKPPLWLQLPQDMVEVELVVVEATLEEAEVEVLAADLEEDLEEDLVAEELALMELLFEQ